MSERSPILKSAWLDVNGLRLHTRVPALPPAGPTVVLLHGLGVSGRYMVPLAEALAGACRVIVPDLPGFGRSDKPRRVLTVPELSDWLVAWMDAAGVPRASLVGNSLGCQVAVDCAVRYPERVDRLVLQGPTMDRHARSALTQIVRLGLAALREPLSVWGIVLLDYLRCGPWRALRTLHYGLADPVVEKLSRVQAPALVVFGGRDPIVPRRWAEELARGLPHGQLAEMPRAGHIPNYSAPAELAALVLAFLRAEDLPRSTSLHAAGRGMRSPAATS